MSLRGYFGDIFWPLEVVGLAFGILIAMPWQMDDDFRWIDLYNALTSVIIFALLTWVVYIALPLLLSKYT
jgi:hypothetical protein